MINDYAIKVGDLIERSTMRNYRIFGYVISIKASLDGYTEFWCNWSDESSTHEGYVTCNAVIGHWKVINFEKENKMTTKTLNETEKLNLLLNGKELVKVGTDTVYRMKNNRLEHKNASTQGEYINGKLPLNDLLSKDFVEYKETLKYKFKVGDWARVTLSDKRVWLIQIAEVDGESLRGTIYEEITGRLVDQYGNLINYPDRKFELMAPEQVKEYKVGQVFKTVEREPYKYKSMDVVMYNGELNLVDYVHPNGLVDMFSMEKTWLTRLSVPSKELTPIYFAEDKVKLKLED